MLYEYIFTGQADRTLVLLDVNLLNTSCEKPLYISPSSKQKLLGTITMDTDLLCSHNLGRNSTESHPIFPLDIQQNL